MFLDYFDYDKPLHSRTEIIQTLSLSNLLFSFPAFKKAEIDAEINTVELSDNPF
jgi:hypothetical protein